MMLVAVLGRAIGIISYSGGLGILATLDARDEEQKTTQGGHTVLASTPWVIQPDEPLHQPSSIYRSVPACALTKR
jgi:hypothetical protein